MPGNVMLGQVI